MLTFHSTHEMAISKAEQRRLWAAFLAGGTSHSGNASTLPYILRRCEQERVEYTLRAMPGTGYFVAPAAKHES